MRHFIYLLITALSLCSYGAAQEVTFSATPPRSGKLNYKLSLKPGESTIEKVRIFNGSSVPLDFRIYSGQAETGLNGALNGPLFGEPVSGVGTWIKPREERVRLEPRQRTEVEFEVSIPEGVEPGDHVGFLFVDVAPDYLAGLKPPTEAEKLTDERASFQVKVSTRFALAVVTRVPGELVSELEITSLSKFVKEGELGLQVQGANTGNVYLKPSGRWALYGPDGEVVAKQDREPWGVLLPGSEFERIVPLKTDRPLVRGIYKLEVEARYTPPDEPDEKSKVIERTLEITLP